MQAYSDHKRQSRIPAPWVNPEPTATPGRWTHLSVCLEDSAGIRTAFVISGRHQVMTERWAETFARRVGYRPQPRPKGEHPMSREAQETRTEHTQQCACGKAKPGTIEYDEKRWAVASHYGEVCYVGNKILREKETQ
jgi:hypothetical protein